MTKASPSLVTTANPSGTIYASTTAPILKDSAVLSGGYYETGTITFTLYYNGGSSPVDTETVTVHGNGTYTTPTGYTLPSTVTVPATYQWDASYSGDSNNNSISDPGSSAAEHVTFSGDQVAKNEAATMGFWANTNGQTLLKTYGTNLGNWLASTYSNLFGNLNGATGTQVAAYFILAKSNAGGLIGNTYAQALTTALDVWVTTTGWNTSSTGPQHYGFQQGFGGAGLGSIYYNVGSNGASFGVANNTMLTVNQILTYLNTVTHRTGGSTTSLPTGLYFYSPSDTTLTNGANNVLNGINQAGDLT